MAWAKTQSAQHHRVNPIHGEEEIKIVLEVRFRAAHMEEEETTQQGNFQMEAWPGLFTPSLSMLLPLLCQDEAGTLLDTSIPDMLDPNAGPSSTASSSKEEAPAPSAGNIMSFKCRA